MRDNRGTARSEGTQTWTTAFGAPSTTCCAPVPSRTPHLTLAAELATAFVCLILMVIGNTQGALAPVALTLFYS